MDSSETPLIEKSKLSCCVIWIPIPGLTWILPLFGHIGVTDSKGVTYDFQGSGIIGKGHTLFGTTKEYWKIDVDPQIWDEAVSEVSQRFGSIDYNFLFSNCHYFAAAVLDRVNVNKSILGGKWVNGATLKIAVGVSMHGRYISVRDMILSWLPFIFICSAILLYAFFK